MKTPNLKPCPFCGGKAEIWSCDRLISIGCPVCNYKRTFHGLVQSEFETKTPIQYSDGTISDHEWYDSEAYDRAFDAWNRRANDEN